MAKKPKTVSIDKTLEDISSELLTLLSVKAKSSVSFDEKNDALVVNIDAGEESGLLIGSRGRTLQSIQTVLGLIYRQRNGEWKRIIVDISDWREKEEERLKELAEKTAERAIATGEPQSLYNLTPSQRRTVHMVLSENTQIKTESQGEGNDRFLVVSSKE